MKLADLAKASAFAAALFAAAASHAATTIGFDDLPGDGSSIQNGYAGLDWNNFGSLAGSILSPSGYQNGVVSGPNVAFNEFGQAASVTSSTPFGVVGFDMTAAWNNGLQVSVVGQRNGVVIDQKTITVNTSGPQFFTLDWAGLDELDFLSYGGTNAGLAGSGEHFALDNLTLGSVPEPSTWAVCILGLALVGATMRRQSRLAIA